MLSLDSPEWSSLSHAYGAAQDVPALLARLVDGSAAADTWNALWSALAHQDDVYDASFAAVPWVIDALALDPAGAADTYYQFPAWVEICRCKAGQDVPAALAPAYFSALQRLPSLTAIALAVPCDEARLRCILASIAAAKAQTEMAEALLELSPEVADRFLDWYFNGAADLAA